MTFKHKLKFLYWSTFVALLFFFYPKLSEEYQSYRFRAWETGQAAMDRYEWMARKLFRHRFYYEYHCQDCGGFTTSYGLCVDCGKRHSSDVQRKARPM